MAPTENTIGYRAIGDLATIVEYGSSAKTHDDSSGVPVLRMGNMHDGALTIDNLTYLPDDDYEFPKLLLQPEDLAFNRTNSAELVRKSAIHSVFPSPCGFASYLIRLRFSEDVVPEFVTYCLNSAYGRNWIHSDVSQQVGQANVSGGKRKAFQIPVPSREAQHGIVEDVEAQLASVAEQNWFIERCLLRAIRLRQSVLR